MDGGAAAAQEPRGQFQRISKWAITIAAVAVGRAFQRVTLTGRPRPGNVSNVKPAEPQSQLLDSDPKFHQADIATMPLGNVPLLSQIGEPRNSEVTITRVPSGEIVNASGLP